MNANHSWKRWNGGRVLINWLIFYFSTCVLIFIEWFRWFHLAFNLIVQLLVGLPLEMVHGSSRIACVYLAGVLAGSMGTSIFDPEVYLVGASGGVYALLAAHLANVMLNYNNMHYGIIRIVGIFLFGMYRSIYSIKFKSFVPPPPTKLLELSSSNSTI